MQILFPKKKKEKNGHHILVAHQNTMYVLIDQKSDPTFRNQITSHQYVFDCNV